MTSRAHLLRQLFVVLRLQQLRRAVPFEELQAYLLEQTPVGDQAQSYTLRTFQRDRRQIAEWLGVTIDYNSARRGYEVTETDALPAGHRRLLEAFELQAFLQLPAVLTPYVQLEQRRALGLEHLRPLLRAAQQRQWVAFDYRKFWEDEPARRTVAPLMLKEFRGRWYVLGLAADRQDSLRCFGLDRLQALELLPRRFGVPADFDPQTYYQDCFGIFRPDEEAPQRVLLALDADQGQYVKSYPLHHSQRVLVDDDAEVRVELRVYVTHDLLMEVLSMGERVRVLEPAGLREQVEAASRQVLSLLRQA
ncbi:WYL domain-containing protein [Hymenobacter gummosus]|uniref:WYL domain-containing protein n=1 Tax=Hymenobacter gummosus TaxID=1776032 RepID=A0A3S0QK30_9BACT|nr:WYL domain-containing protein [Hymenobacter gummosus]RTQ52306.1 WYL domain-containing protein [Hymenobacter gummosus]